MFKFGNSDGHLHHLDLACRKLVVPLTVFARTVDADLGPESSLAPIILQMRINVRQESLQIDAIMDNSTPLDMHLRRAFRSAYRYAPRVPKAAAAAALTEDRIRRQRGARTIALRFARGVRTINCERCGKNHGHKCDGSDRDDLTVRNGGECWTPFLTIYNFCFAAVSRLYDRHMASTRFPDVEVTIKTLRGEDGGAGVQSTTDFVDVGQDNRRSFVNIEVPVYNYEPMDYYSAMYLVYHELFVHAAQQLCTDDGRRRVLGDTCVFAEGLMDSVAYQALLEEMSAAPVDIAALGKAFVSATDKVHADRYLWLTKTGSLKPAPVQALEATVLRARAKGQVVFDELMKSWSLDEIMACLLPLNVDKLSGAQREAIVQELYFRAREKDDGGIAWGEALDALLEYGESHDLGALLNSIIPGAAAVCSFARSGIPCR